MWNFIFKLVAWIPNKNKSWLKAQSSLSFPGSQKINIFWENSGGRFVL
jgi:hypothetical protein